jgi:hypothetical protein
MNYNLHFQNLLLSSHFHAIIILHHCHLVRKWDSLPFLWMVLPSIGTFNNYELSRRVFKVAASDYEIHRVRPSVLPSAPPPPTPDRPHETTRLLLDGFSWNFVLVLFTTLYQKNSSFIKIRQKTGTWVWTYVHEWLLCLLMLPLLSFYQGYHCLHGCYSDYGTMVTMVTNITIAFLITMFTMVSKCAYGYFYYCGYQGYRVHWLPWLCTHIRSVSCYKYFPSFLSSHRSVIKDSILLGCAVV